MKYSRSVSVIMQMTHLLVSSSCRDGDRLLGTPSVQSGRAAPKKVIGGLVLDRVGRPKHAARSRSGWRGNRVLVRTLDRSTGGLGGRSAPRSTFVDRFVQPLRAFIEQRLEFRMREDEKVAVDDSLECNAGHVAGIHCSLGAVPNGVGNFTDLVRANLAAIPCRWAVAIRVEQSCLDASGTQDTHADASWCQFRM